MKIQRTPLFAESWNIAYRFCAQGTILTDKKTPFHIIKNSWRYWAADPMVFEHCGNIFIFAELYDYVLRRGIIGYTQFNRNGFSSWKPIIREVFHMSYPFIFGYDGDIYMLPETSAAGQLRVYRAVHFPDKWELDCIVKDNVQWVDTTIVPSVNGEFVGFTQSLDGKEYKIRLDSSFHLLDCNELENNSNYYRNGGPIFYYESGQVRVTQDCKEDYGQALFFRSYIGNLDEEISAERVEPTELCFSESLLLDGMHTYSATNSIEVIDVKTRRFNLVNLLFRLKSKIIR